MNQQFEHPHRYGTERTVVSSSLLACILLLVLLVLSGSPAQAQSPSVWLRAGFTPDPHQQRVTAGGTVRAASWGGNGCAGYINSTPTLTLNWSGSTANLRIFATSSADLTLMVIDPFGDAYCNDDFSGNNPLVRLANPASGYYEIYVGRYSSGTASGNLYITERNLDPSNVGSSGGGSGGSGSGSSGSSQGGSVALGAGFLPDPWSTAFNVRSARTAGSVSSGCSGHIEWTPTLTLAFSGSSRALELYVRSTTDTVLLVRDPAGRIVCDDDSGGSNNPKIVFTNPRTGNYEIYVGTYSANHTATGSLFISERVSTASAASNALRLRAGFTPDPYERSFSVRPTRSSGVLNTTCRGYIESAPTQLLQWSGNSSHVRFYVTSSTDTVLAVRDPAGRIYCSDDWSSNSSNPLVMLDNPREGLYEVYVGTYSSNSSASGRLFISEYRSNNPESPR